tara:strand:+ start:236 stop:463 length:228 start_codon:yes stop_codon:yes gene_type:complete
MAVASIILEGPVAIPRFLKARCATIKSGVTIKIPRRSVENHENQNSAEAIGLTALAIVALQTHPITAESENHIKC